MESFHRRRLLGLLSLLWLLLFGILLALNHWLVWSFLLLYCGLADSALLIHLDELLDVCTVGLANIIVHAFVCDSTYVIEEVV